MTKPNKARILYMEDDLGLGRLLQKRLRKRGMPSPSPWTGNRGSPCTVSFRSMSC